MISSVLLGLGLAACHANEANEADEAAEKLETKGFSPEWIRLLTSKGRIRQYSGKELKYIGMPVGGQYAGQVYLSGDGQLWYWDVFNQRIMNPGGPGDVYYNKPMLPKDYVGVKQGFWLEIDGKKTPLNGEGFSEITFTGAYPLAHVEMRDDSLPVDVRLTAYSPFAPLNDRDSAIPATVMSYAISNPGTKIQTVRLGGWLENPTHRSYVAKGVVQPKMASVLAGRAILFSGELPKNAGKRRDDIILDDFENGYSKWTVKGKAFGERPFVQTDRKPWQQLSSQGGTALVNSHNTYLGENSQEADSYIGLLTSKPFTIKRKYIAFKIAGGRHPGKTSLRLKVAGKVVAEKTGDHSLQLKWANFDTKAYQGKKAVLEIVDQATGVWGHIMVDDIMLTDQLSIGLTDPDEAPDAGTFSLVLLDQKPDGIELKNKTGELRSGAITLKPGQTKTVSFAICWHMPNIHNGERALWALKEMKQQRHYYTEFYQDAESVAADLLKRHESLREMTLSWVDTWYDSTLPKWFLGRTIFNISTLATTTAHRFHHPDNPSLNHRPYFWEGVYLGDGTCTHVTHYEQAFGRLFPQAGRDQRRAADYDAGWDEKLGYVRYRAEYGYGHHFGIPHAADGHAGTILRTYREHTTSKDDAFLRSHWPKVKRAMQFMIDQDAGRGFFENHVPDADKNSQPDGLLTGPQYNTLDRYWFGKIPWISGLYQAALLASAEMSEEMGDAAFASTCHVIAALGKKNLTGQLYSEDFGYYVQKGYEGHKAININNGSHIDQLLGQYWADQVGLGRVFPEKESRNALSKLFEHNFYKNAGDYRSKAFVKAARFYADDDEAGMFMCTFPHGGAEQSVNESGVIGGYFSECMDGFTYAAAATMISDGMILEGLALCRSVDDRYAGSPSRRNPFNEVEYGNHYSRSMASYAAYVSMCGFTYHGPRKEIGFSPQMQAENFKAAFTAAEGWGTFSQKRVGGQQFETLKLKSGKLTLKTLRFTGQSDQSVDVKVSINGQDVPAKLIQLGKNLGVTLEREVTLKVGDTLQVEFR